MDRFILQTTKNHMVNLMDKGKKYFMMKDSMVYYFTKDGLRMVNVMATGNCTTGI